MLAIYVPLRALGKYANPDLLRIVAAGLLATGDAALRCALATVTAASA